MTRVVFRSYSPKVGCRCHLAAVDLIALCSAQDLRAYFEGLLACFYRRDAGCCQILEPVRVLRCSLMGREDDESFAVREVLHRGQYLRPLLRPVVVNNSRWASLNFSSATFPPFFETLRRATGYVRSDRPQ